MLIEVTVRLETGDCIQEPDSVLIVVDTSGDGGDVCITNLARLACAPDGELAQTLLRVHVADEDGEVVAYDYLDHTTLWLTPGQVVELIAYWFRENVAATEADDDGDWPMAVSITWQAKAGCAPVGRVHFTHHADTLGRALLHSEVPLPVEWVPADLARTGETLTRTVCPAPYGEAMLFLLGAVGALQARYLL